MILDVLQPVNNEDFDLLQLLWHTVRNQSTVSNFSAAEEPVQLWKKVGVQLRSNETRLTLIVLLLKEVPVAS